MEKKRLFDPQALALYVYARNNPLKFIDPEGMQYVEKDGNSRVIYGTDKDGKIVHVSGTQTKDLKELVKAINQSGSTTAVTRFMALNDNQTKITIKIGSSGEIGIHSPHDKDGNLLDMDKAEDRAKVTFTSDGKAYAAATISFNRDLIYDKKDLQSRKGMNPYINGADEMTAIFAHESLHDTDSNQIGAVFASQLPANQNRPFDLSVFHPENRDRLTASPKAVGNLVRDEIANYKKTKRR